MVYDISVSDTLKGLRIGKLVNCSGRRFITLAGLIPEVCFLGRLRRIIENVMES